MPDMANEADDSPAMKLLYWVASTLAWDGLLPAFIALIPIAVRLALPRNDAAQILTFTLIPLMAAIARAGVAHYQLARVCHGATPWGRQIVLALAIVCLLISEALFGVLVFAPDAPLEDWLVPLGCYSSYLLLILWALRPTPTSAPAQ